MSAPYVRLDKNNTAALLVDHQSGLLSLVRDIEPDKFKNNYSSPELVTEVCVAFPVLSALLGALFSNHIPDYRNLISSYTTLNGAK